MKKIKIIIIILIILMIIAAMILAILIGKKSDDNLEIPYIKVTESDIEKEGYTEEYNEYFDQNKYALFYDTVKLCIYNFYNSLNSQMYYYPDDDGNYILQSNKEINLNIINFLSKDYIEKNNISSDNLNKFIKLLDKNQKIEILDIKAVSGKVTDTFAVHGVAVSGDYILTEEFYLYVFIDQKNQTFAIEPINQNISDFSKFEIISKDVAISNNGSNMLSNTYSDVIVRVQNYIETYKILALAKTEYAYNLLDEEYRIAHFGSFDNFKKYVENNKEDIKKIIADSYLTEYDNGITDYIIKDQYDNLYIFSEKSPLEYTLKLDTYTIPTEKFKTSYRSGRNVDKVAANIDKFFQMINAGDYHSAYQTLNEGFKNNNFKTEESFEKYMRENIYRHPSVKYIYFSDEISGVFTYRIELTNKENENDKPMEMNFVMQLQDNYDFTLSFERVK